MEVEFVTEPDRWRAALCRFDAFDFVHTYDYHEANAAIEDGSPLAFVVHENGEPALFWPCLRRDIDASDRFDLTSVYGYGGPVVRKGVDPGLCLDLLFDAMRAHGAVSLFSRMHPLFPLELGNGDSLGESLSEVVVIDVHQIDDPAQDYRGSHRREIINARRAGLSTYVAAGPDARRDFVDIYTCAMRDIGARAYYFFNREFFDQLFDATDFRTRMIFAEFGGRRVAAAMFTTSCGIMQYFLSGALPEARKLAPAKAIIEHAHRTAIAEQLTTIVLGGGVGSSRDALFKFKIGFSENTRSFRIVKKILDADAYDDLRRSKGVAIDAAFFPAYRAPSN